jgi:hypothetical protein
MPVRLFAAVAAVLLLVGACSSGPDHLNITVSVAAPYFAADATSQPASSVGTFACHGAGRYADLGPQTKLVIVSDKINVKPSAVATGSKLVGGACEFAFAPLEVPAGLDFVTFDVGPGVVSIGNPRGEWQKRNWTETVHIPLTGAAPEPAPAAALAVASRDRRAGP